ncbi:polysaccharide biosynthesis tyrosine autokinase [Micromonospora sp. WMMD1102]|uniref:polysaccharide biosynthesis tyrosine autokinase n=1 Tax=Micromonospora sp. WMMD1102 TaxID=3016105 RepID=UPI0024156578|nr:polysaccharide biosynthesis tyrosine autokinase [Micromonospora sp. WMMD1102]MDG4787391.1 polysaccharide biosynthesis tyrosine autokinase [Micromonospora sp. WMMD1102]
MDLQTYLRALRQRWWVVVVTVMAALGAAGFVTVRATPQYASSVTFFVTAGSGTVNAYQGNFLLQQRVKSYVDLLTSDRLAQSVVAEERIGLTADGVRSRVSARVEAETVLLAATVTDSDQTRALRITEALAKHFIRLVQAIETPPGVKDPAIKIEVVGGPRVEAQPVSPRPVRNLVLAGALGLMLGIALALLRRLTDTTLQNGEALEKVTSAPLLGSIPYDGQARSNPLIVGPAAQTARAEAMRKLRTNLRFVDAQEPARVIAVTSAVQAEGKSTLAANLAITLAEAGWQVLLVDADLRHPRVAGYLGLGAGAGLTDVLIGEVAVEDVLQPWGDKSLLVLPAGSVPPNPSELLGSKAMADLLLSLRELTDIVIIDTPPLLAFTDGVVVAVQADGALLVARQGRTPSAQTAAAAQALHSVSARVLGCVLNMSKENRIDVEQYRAYRRGAPAETVRTARAEEPAAAGPVRVPPNGTVAAASADKTEELDRVPR